MKIESVFVNAVELGQATLGEAPERFDAVDVIVAKSELVVGMIDPEMLGETQVNQAVVADPAVGMKYAFERNVSPYHLLQGTFSAIGNNLSEDFVASFEEAEDDRFATGSAATLAFDSSGTEVRLIDFDDSVHRRDGLTDSSQAASQLQIDAVDRTNADPGKCGGLGGC